MKKIAKLTAVLVAVSFLAFANPAVSQDGTTTTTTDMRTDDDGDDDMGKMGLIGLAGLLGLLGLRRRDNDKRDDANRR